MKIFSPFEAQHYCMGYLPQHVNSHPTLKSFVSKLRNNEILQEGTANFSNFRNLSLENSERFLFMAVSNYRKCVDLVGKSSIYWFTVTAYYGCYFAAHALLGLFGGTILTYKFVEVDQQAIGQQAFVIRQIGKRSPGGYSGSHEKFWDIFFLSVKPLLMHSNQKFGWVLTPLSNDPTWLTDIRNRYNYDSKDAVDLCISYHNTFELTKFPITLPESSYNTFNALENLLLLTYDFVDQLSFSTTAMTPLFPQCGTNKIKEIICSETHPLITKLALTKSIAK